MVIAAAGGLVAAAAPAMATAAPANNFKQTDLIANKASFGAKLVDSEPQERLGARRRTHDADLGGGQ